MAYTIRFAGKDVGNIFHIAGMIHLTDGVLTVRVPATEYHQRMAAWIVDRMARPLVWAGDNGIRCVMTAPSGPGDVEVELKT